MYGVNADIFWNKQIAMKFNKKWQHYDSLYYQKDFDDSYWGSGLCPLSRILKTRRHFLRDPAE
jgi:hypothetical protein